MSLRILKIQLILLPRPPPPPLSLPPRPHAQTHYLGDDPVIRIVRALSVNHSCDNGTKDWL